MSPLRLPLLCALAAVALTRPGGAADTPPAAPHVITAEDLWAIKRPSALRLSPDGSKLAYALKEFDLEKNTSVAHLWILDTATGAARKLTAAESSDADPAWSPDGTRIAFASKRGADEQASLYVIPVAGGEAEKVLELPLAISLPHWLPGGKAIVVVTEVIPALQGDLPAEKAELKKQKDRKVTAKVTENEFYRYFDTWKTEERATHLLKVDLATHATTDLTPHWDRAWSFDGSTNFDISPDGQWIALGVGTTPPPYHPTTNLDVYLLSVAAPETPWKNLTTDNPKGDDDEPRFSADGKSIYFLRRHDEGDEAENLKLMRCDVATGQVAEVFPGLDLSVHEPRFTPDGATLYFHAEDHGRTKIFRSAGGAAPVAVVSDGTNTSLAVGAASVFYLKNSYLRPDEVYAFDAASGAATVRSHINDELFSHLKLGKVEEHTYAGAGGDPIELWMIYPPDFDPKKKYPLLVLMHGGPQTMLGDVWQPRWNAQVFVTPGYVAVWMNRHGSTGFGEQFAESIKGAWGEKPFEDIMKGTDYLLHTFSFLDKDRTAALGASYGGYMAAWVCGHTDRFKAIVCHDGALDFNTQYASDVANYWQDLGMGGSPWHRTPAYDKENAINYADHFHTPTLVIQGGMDYRVPTDQALEFYGALKGQGVPARLLYFPDENHWVLHPQNSVFWYHEVRDWLGRWLK